MVGPPTGVNLGETSIRWADARTFLRERLSRHLDRADPATVEDLAQEALVRLLRATRREQPRNLEALMTEIARRTYVDFVRRRRVQHALFAPLDDADRTPDPAAEVIAEIGDPVRRVRFIVLEFFESRHAACLELATAFFSGKEWAALASERGLRPEAVRQQWLRCVNQLRRMAKNDKGLLQAWAQAAS